MAAKLYRIDQNTDDYLIPSLITLDIFKTLGLAEEFFADCISIATTQRRFASVWTKPVPIRFKAIAGYASTPVTPDITLWNGTCLILSNKALENFKNDLTPYGEMLSLCCDKSNYFLFHTLTTLDVDEQKTVYEIYKSTPVGLKSLSLKTADETSLVFRAFPEQGYGGIFCNERFKHLCSKIKHNGLSFQRIN